MSKVMLLNNMAFASWKKQAKDNIFNIVFVCILFYINCATPKPLHIPSYFFYCLFRRIFQYVLHLQVLFCDFIYTCYYHLRRLSVIRILSLQQCHQTLLYQRSLMYSHYTPLLPNHPSKYKNRVVLICARYPFNRAT